MHLDNGFVESRMVNGPEMSEIEESLLRIPSSYRLVLYLYYYEGYKIAEIASLETECQYDQDAAQKGEKTIETGNGGQGRWIKRGLCFSLKRWGPIMSKKSVC